MSLLRGFSWGDFDKILHQFLQTAKKRGFGRSKDVSKAVKVESDGCLKRAKKVMTSIAFATFSSVTGNLRDDFCITKSLDKIMEVTL